MPSSGWTTVELALLIAGFSIVVLAVVFSVVRWRNGADGRREREEAVRLLRFRYARGEIDRDTYQRKRREL